MSYVTNLVCLSCRQVVAPEPFVYFCPRCGGYLDVEYDYERMRADLAPSDFISRQGPILQQWQEFMPIERPELIARVTLGEQPTPMIQANQLPEFSRTGALWLKNESQSPTCSLKDRSMPLTVLKALEFGRRAVGIVSVGNAASSLAAYAARAGLQAVVLLSQHASASKLYKTMIYNPIAIQLQGSYSAAEPLFQQARQEFDLFDCNGLVNPYRAEGKKSFAYEVARDLGWRAPDVVFMPTAYGNGIVAAWKGFQELYRLGFISSLPALVAVQAAAVAPIARAFERGLSQVEAVPDAPTLAEAVRVSDPAAGGQRVLQVVRESGGMAIGVEEEEIVEAVHLLAEREGLAIEPTGAVGLAAAIKLMRQGSPWADGIQVVSVTGHGLNAVESGGALVRAPLQVPLSYPALQQALREVLA